ncbi:YetF domain-containing protein [Streptomyces sp. NPDC005708]|uniref:DUF421 domain-containing protein n=1 Tax=Streptomyces sp. NPDC005708 TaxID=3154564 RepID=UPI003405E3F9
MSELWTLSASDVAMVVISTTIMYAIFVVSIRVIGQRTLTSLSITDMAAIVTFGAVIGRTVLLLTPTLGRGVVALLTLFLLQRLTTLVKRSPWISRLLDRKPVLVVVNGVIKYDELRRARITLDELRQCLRQAGISQLNQVGHVILETTGQISVTRRDFTPDPMIFADVPGAIGDRHDPVDR